MAATQAAAQPSAEWDEAQCTAALAQLERLETQLDDLRLVIPRVVEPFYSPPTPAMYRAFKEGITTSLNDIKNFRNQWESDELQSIYKHARQSHKANSDLSASTQVQEYGWIEKQEKGREAAKRKKSGTEMSEEAQVSLTRDGLGSIVEAFKKTHPNISLKTQDNDHDLTIAFISAASRYVFHVVIEQEANGRHKLNAECLSGTDPTTITRCIASRSQANDLPHLLNMTAAYKTIPGKTCAKCAKMLDAEANTSMARRMRQIAGPNGAETVWEAYHESCLE